MSQDGVCPVTLLPGEEMVAEGRRDLAQGRETVASLLVSIGAPHTWQIGWVAVSSLTPSFWQRWDRVANYLII